MSKLLRILGAALVFNLAASSDAPRYFDELKKENPLNNLALVQKGQIMRDRFDKMAKEGRIITGSAQDYCMSHKKDIQNYDLLLIKSTDSEEEIIGVLPQKTEAIIGFSCNLAKSEYSSYKECYGTALIPKLNKSKLEAEK